MQRAGGHLVASTVDDPDRVGRTVDEVMLVRMAPPRTYTREEVVEISCHGGPVPVREVLALCLRHGARLAEPGEFTLRAFLNGRIDLSQAEAVAGIVGARTPRSLDLAVVPTFATRWLLPRLSGFRAMQPGIHVNLETRTRPFLFADTDFDAALYAGTAADIANWPGTQATELLAEEVVPVCASSLIAPRRRLSPQQVAALPLLQQSTRPYAWRQWFEAQGVSGVRSTKRPT